MNDASQHVERYVCQTFGLDFIGLQRVALFLLAHVLVDTRLIARALFKEVSGRGGLPLTAIQAIADDVSAATFGPHLDRVRAGLDADNVETAEQLNEARNALLHLEARALFSPRL